MKLHFGESVNTEEVQMKRFVSTHAKTSHNWSEEAETSHNGHPPIVHDAGVI